MMIVKHWSGKTENMSLEDVINYEVSSAHSERGQIEDVEEKLELLSRMFASLVESLGEPTAVMLLEKHGRCYKPGE